MIEVPSGSEQIVIVGDFQLFSAQELFEYWVQPDLLKYWWTERAETDPRVGGRYKLSWPEMDWVLEGEYTTVEPGKHLGFTWSWNHEPEVGPKQVDVYFSELAEATRVGIYHSPFEGNSADRQGVVEGWIHFGMRLAGLRRMEEE